MSSRYALFSRFLTLFEFKSKQLARRADVYYNFLITYSAYHIPTSTRRS